MRGFQVQSQMRQPIGLLILSETAVLIKPYRIVPADIRFQHQPPKPSLARNLHQPRHQSQGDAFSSQFTDNRHAHDAPRLPALAQKRPGPNHLPIHFCNDEGLA